MYYDIFYIGNLILYILLGISFILLLQKIIYHVVGIFSHSKRFPDAKKNHKFAILIPARNESRVIEQLLQSIKNQKYDHNCIKTYVIVESESDPTCEIAKKYKNTEIFVRQHLERKGKGHALDEALNHIFASKEKFDAFMICDADNVLDENFVYEMNKSYDAGYKLCLGYRNSKNWNGGWIASCTALTFSLLNTFQNKSRAKFNHSITVSGTGFYISADILEKLGGYKFYTLTEDVEISMYGVLNNIKSTYNEFAEFYDEQPTKLKVSWHQRLRWVKGYGQVNKKYQKKLLKSAFTDKQNRLSKLEFGMSILPAACLVATVIIYAIFTLILGIVGACTHDPLASRVFIAFGITIGSMYLFFVLYALLMLFAERKHSDITLKNLIVCCLMNPFYWALYIPIYVTALFKKEVEWKPIEHSVQMTQKQENPQNCINELIEDDDDAEKVAIEYN